MPPQAPTLIEQRDEVLALLDNFTGTPEEETALLARADQIVASIEQANTRDARRRALAGAIPPGDPQPQPNQPGPQGGGQRREQPGLQPDDRGNPHPVTVAETFVRSVALQNHRANGYIGKIAVEHRDAPAGTTTTTTYPLQNTRVPGVIPAYPDYPLLIANLLDRQTTDGTTIEYLRDISGPVTGSGTWNKAAVVAEGAVKPQSGPAVFETITTSTKTVAHWWPITRQAADDNSQLMGYINGRLSYGLDFKLDRQILTGNGTTEMQGILTTSGIGTYQPASGNTDSKLITIRKAKTLGELALYPPDAVVMNPLDWQDVELDTDGIGNFRVISSVQDAGGPARIWGLTVVSSVAMASGTALLGGFRAGATLWERQGITILMSDSHGELFIANTLVVLAERRANVAVHVPAAFVKITFAALP